jgi:histidinol dehydrogenase
MRILDWNTLDRQARRAALARPHVQVRAEVTRVTAELIREVRRDGDTALRALTQRFDAAEIKSLIVDRNEFAIARRGLTERQVAALERAIVNVERFHNFQLPMARIVETEDGVLCEELIRPLAKVGLYVPGGTAPLPSTVIMLAVPARIAGCAQRVLCTPPRRDGSVHPAVLVAAQLCGISTVFRVGGAQAIAALAYGTESLPKVDKIFGPGNSWVAAAKALVANDPEGAACDLPAGPSEVLVVADETSQAEFVAADLLAQAEHDVLAQAILVTDSHTLASAVVREIRKQRKGLSRGEILTHSLGASRAIVVPDLDTALQVANEYAPEHLILQVKEPRRYLAHVQNAGAVFLGPWSPEPLGDYCSGTNHVLPTYGYARTSSGLSVRDFVKTVTVQEISPAGLSALGPTAVTLAWLEGLDAHASAVERRLAALSAEHQDSGPRAIASTLGSRA